FRWYGLGGAAIALPTGAGAAVQPDVLKAAPRGTTPGPATPALPLWMCDAVAPATPFRSLNCQQTFVPVIWMYASPLAEPAFGASFLPASLASSDIVFVAEPSASVGTSAAAARTSPTAMSFRTASSLPR